MGMLLVWNTGLEIYGWKYEWVSKVIHSFTGEYEYVDQISPAAVTSDFK